MKKTILLLFVSLVLTSCSELNQVIESMPTYGITEPTTMEINQGLKAALEKGTLEGVSDLAVAGGFLDNGLYRIPFPKDAIKVENTLRDLGFDEEIDRVVVSLNRAAEKAVIEAKPIFVDAIKSMTFEDVRNILFGADTAATSYLKRKTTEGLQQSFQPHIEQSLSQVNATKYWAEIMTKYNKIPFVTKVDTDLSGYVTNKAIQALFLKIAEEEMAIRENPQERTTELLRKVFSYADRGEQ